MGISQIVTLYRLRRDEFGELVAPRRKDKYTKVVRFDRPPMLYIEIKYAGGGTRNVGFERTGPDEYTEIIKETKDATRA